MYLYSQGHFFSSAVHDFWLFSVHELTKTMLFREAIMEKILKELDENHPTLF